MMEPSAGPSGSRCAALPATVLLWSSRGWNRSWVWGRPWRRWRGWGLCTSPALGSWQCGLAAASAKGGAGWGGLHLEGDVSGSNARVKVCMVSWTLPHDRRAVVPFPCPGQERRRQEDGFFSIWSLHRCSLECPPCYMWHGHATAVSRGVPVHGMARTCGGLGGQLWPWVQWEEGLHQQQEETCAATAAAGRKNNPNKQTHQKSLISVLRRETAEIV